MNKKFLIKTTALLLLEEIYLKANCNFQANIDATKYVNENRDMDMIQKAAYYLKEKNYIHYDIAPFKQWSVTMTATGVDWIEECYKVNPTDNIKE